MIVEPVTKSTLIDTAIAQLETLTVMCNLLSFRPGQGLLAWVDEYASNQLRAKIAAYLDGSGREHDASLAYATFVGALDEVVYQSGRMDIDTYHREITNAFNQVDGLYHDPDGLCCKADTLTSFNSAVSEGPPTPHSLSLQWQSLSAALDALTMASKLPGSHNLAGIHLARGDAEMSRWRLGFPPWSFPPAQQNAHTLIRNAQTYYRGAAALARRDGQSTEKRDGTCKEAIAAAFGGQPEKLKSMAPKDLMTVAEDMVDDGLVNAAEVQPLLLSL